MKYLRREKCRIFGLVTFYCLVNSAFSTTRQTPETSTLMAVCQSLNTYKNYHNSELPLNWESLIHTEFMTPALLADARKYLDIENRYHFVTFPKPFVVNGKNEKIIVIANQSGNEGDYNRPGRFLMVEIQNGDIQTRRYSESELTGIFKLNGYELSNYTFDTPSLKMPEIKLRSTAEKQKNKETLNGDLSSNQNTQVIKKTIEAEKLANKVPLWIAVGISFFTAIVWYFLRRERGHDRR